MSNHRAIRLLLKELSGKDSVVTVPRLFVDLMCGELSGGVFLNQLIFWSDKGKEGWFYKSYGEWKEESFLSRYEVNKYADLLKELDLLEIEKRRNGRSNCLYYRPDIDKICNVIVLHLEHGKDIKEMGEKDFMCENLHMKDVSPVKICTSRSTTDDLLTDEVRSDGENGEQNIIEEPTDDNIVEWFKQRSNSDKQKRLPRTEQDVKDGVVKAVVEHEARRGETKPAIENYLVTLPENVRELARPFCNFRERPPLLSGEDATWRKDWNNQALLGLTPEIVEDALEYMREKQLPIRAPASVTVVAENIKTGQLRVGKSGATSSNFQQARQVSFGDSGDDVDPMSDLLKD